MTYRTTIFTFAFFLTLAFTPSFAEHNGIGLARINKSVVKIFSVHKTPSYSQPWQYKNQVRSIGSGAIIEGGRILTNAHVVGNAVFIEVKKANDPKKYVAYVESVGHECDLAILKTKDKSFFENTSPLKLGGLPKLHDSVSVYGFPAGGSEISITQGIVSRIEQLNYAHSRFKLLGAQIDAAVNPGNSGGPALVKDKIVGIAMQSLRSGDNIGYIIPTPIINHFLTDIEDGKFDGFPDGGVRMQELENQALRDYYRLDKTDTGVAVIKVLEGSSAWGVVEVGDVLTHLEGVNLANDGTVKLDKNLRVSASYLIQQRYIGDVMKVRVIRDGRPLELEVKLKETVELSPLEHDKKPSYFIYGGLVLMPLTDNFLKVWGQNYYRRAPMSLIYNAKRKDKNEEMQEVVFLRTVLAHEINAGYHKFQNIVVEKVNGENVLDLKSLTKALYNNDSQFTVFELEKGIRIVLDKSSVQKADEEIIARYGIPARMSEDLR